MMNCPHCSTANPDFATSCKECSTPLLSVNESDSETIQMVDPAAITLGSDFGTRYRIESLLGQGGMGRVYKAYDKDLDRTVAIKVVREGAIGQADSLKRFKQELVLASKISHKNILRIHDMGGVGGVRFISMAYIQGKDLQHIIRENPKMPLERVLKFAQQIAEALAAAHAEGVVHRDLKPQNLLIGNDDQVFVCDFGLAKSFEESATGMTRAGAFLGTPRYMSPEQVEGKPADQRADLYAFGLILYEMVTGDVPFTGESTLQVMYQRIHEKPKSPKLVNADLPNWLVRIIMRCLEKDLADRYQSAYEILADLQGAKTSSTSGLPRSGSSIQIQLAEFATLRWVWPVAGLLLLLILSFAIPPIRHLILRSGSSTTSSKVPGVPPLSEGKFAAVLPFKVLGEDQSLAYVAEGLNEALSAKLFQLKDLRLASDSAVAKVSEKDSLDKIARNLGVNLIVDGLIQGSADRMSIIVNLHDIAGDKKLWSQQFSGVPKDVLTIEDQISGQLVAALAIKPTSEELASTAARPTDNAEAYDLYLRGRQAYRSRDNTKGTQTAIDYFKQAIEKDPGFALAYTGLADASLAMYGENKDSIFAEKAVGAAQRAEQLKDNLPEVHFSLGSAYFATGKTAQAIAEFKRGLQIAPNSDQGYVRLGNAYLQSGQKEAAIAAFEKAIEVNPYYWVLHRDLGNAYFHVGQNEKALDEFKRVTELQPANAEGWTNVATVYMRLDKYAESIAAYKKSIELAPTWLAYCNVGVAYLLLREYPDAIQALEKAVDLGPSQELAAGNLADAYRYSGQKEKANATYDKAIALAFQDLRVNPQDTEVMGDLASYYAKKGDSARAKEFIQRARTIDKDDLELIHTQALVENFANKPDESVRSLREALSKGFSVKTVQEDPDLSNLQNRPDFQALIKEYSRSPQ
jgi:eukaryotic-like serine/threonine-protein kinase